MKKGGIIAAIIIIILFSIIFLLLGAIRDGLPQPEFGNIRYLKVEKSYSDIYNTFITANFTVKNNAPEFIEITISYDKVECQIFYYDQIIGKIFLDDDEFNLSEIMSNIQLNQGINNFKEPRSPILNISAVQKRLVSTIQGKEECLIYVLFIISNENLSKVFYNHAMKNDEKGKIRFNLSFSFEIKLPIGQPIPIEKNVTINFEKEFITNLLEKIDWMKYNISIPEEDISHYPISNRARLSIYKNIESNVIHFNYSKRFFEIQKPRYDIYIGDPIFWIYNSKPYEIRLGQEMMLYGTVWRLKLLDNIFPLECDLIANNKTTIGCCKIKPVERDYRFSTSNLLELSATINCNNLSKIIYDHIQNENHTIINITNITTNNKIFKILCETFPKIMNRLIPLDKIDQKVFNSTITISDLIPEIELEKIALDTSGVNETLSLFQLLTLIIIINTIIIVIILYFAFWNKGKYLIFK